MVGGGGTKNPIASTIVALGSFLLQGMRQGRLCFLMDGYREGPIVVQFSFVACIDNLKR